MAKTANRPTTYEDLLKVPECLVAEIIDGGLYTSPRPPSRQAKTAGRLYSLLTRAFEDADGGPGGWWTLLEPEVIFGSDRLVPDLAAWRRTKVPEFPDVPAWTIIPNWVCEVLAPATALVDRVRKLPLYARQGVEYVWLVDPVMKMIEAFELKGGFWVLVGVFGDEPSRIEPFDAVEIPLATLWLPESPSA